MTVHTQTESVCFVSHRRNNRENGHLCVRMWLLYRIEFAADATDWLSIEVVQQWKRKGENAMERSLHHLNVHSSTVFSFFSHCPCRHVFALSSSATLAALVFSVADRCLIWLPICPVFIKVRPSFQPTEATQHCTVHSFTNEYASVVRLISICQSADFLLSMRKLRQQFTSHWTVALFDVQKLSSFF